MMYRVFQLIILSGSMIYFIADGQASDRVVIQDQLRALVVEQKLMVNSSDVNINQQFGNAISVSGDMAVIGASKDNLNGSFSGSVFVFEQIGKHWVQMQKLTSNDASSNDEFGASVSIYGDQIMVGARSKEIDGNTFAGAVYVFELINGVWQQTQRLTPNVVFSSVQFGYAVSLDDDHALIGAPSSGDGSVYVYKLDDMSGDWVEVNILTADDGEFGDRFGYAVSLFKTTGLIGANHLQQGEGGAAYIFESFINAGQTKITASDEQDGDDFGVSVSLYKDRALIGANRDDTVAGVDVGSAYLFERDGFNGNWIETQKIIADDAQESDQFGTSVSLSRDRLLIGAWGDDDNGKGAGAAYFYDYVGTSWQQAEKLIPQNGSSGDEFGTAVFLSPTHAFVGAVLDAESATTAGAAYVYREDIIFINGLESNSPMQ